MTSFPELLRAWRLHRSLTQAALSLRSGVAQPNICRMELGTLDPALSTLGRLAAGLGIPLGSLLEKEPPRHELGRFGRDALVRAALGLPGGRLLKPGQARRLRRVFAAKYNVLHGLNKPSPNGDRTRTERKLRSELGPAEWGAIINRTEKLAGSMMVGLDR